MIYQRLRRSEYRTVWMTNLTACIFGRAQGHRPYTLLAFEPTMRYESSLSGSYRPYTLLALCAFELGYRQLYPARG